MDYSIAVGFCKRFAWMDEPLFVPDRSDLRPATVVTQLPFGTATVEPVTRKVGSDRWRCKVNLHSQAKYWEESEEKDMNTSWLGGLVTNSLCRSRRYQTTETTQFGLRVSYRQRNSNYSYYYMGNGINKEKAAHSWRKGWWAVATVWEWTQSMPGRGDTWYWSPRDVYGFERATNPVLFDEAVKVLRNDEGSVWGAWLDQAMSDDGFAGAAVLRKEMEPHFQLAAL